MEHLIGNNQWALEFYTSLNHLLKARGLQLLPDIKIEWSNRMGRALGKCYGRRKPGGKLAADRIVLNARYPWPGQWEIEATIRHEAAHAWTAEHAGRLDHSAAWAHVAKILGDTGHRYAGCGQAAVVSAAENHREVPTNFDELSPKQVHSMRTSFKIICSRYGHPLNAVSFDKFIPRRFPQFSPAAIQQAKKIILGG